jgi:AcrR family transcriptional regulator
LKKELILIALTMYNYTMSAIKTTQNLRHRQRVAQDTKILEAAWNLLDEKGYENWTLAELAEKAGISRRTLYHHFPSKEAIAAETIARSKLKRIEEMMAFEPDLNPLNRLKAIIRCLLTRNYNSDSGPVRTIKDAFGLMAKVKNFASYQKADSLFHDKFADLVAKAQFHGQLTKRFPATYLANLLIEMLQGFDVSRQKKNRSSVVNDVITILFDGLTEQEHA